MVRSCQYSKRAKSGIVRRGRAIAGKLSQVEPRGINARPFKVCGCVRCNMSIIAGLVRGRPLVN